MASFLSWAEMSTASVPATQQSAGGVVSKPNLLRKFTVLRGAPRELWLLFAMKFVSVAAYSVTNRTLVLWMSSDFGRSDQSAGALISGVWAPLMTVITLLVGSVTDAIGLRKTFVLGIIICLGARAVMVLSTVEWIALCFGLFPLAVGEALGNPVLVAGARKFSTTRQRSISFSLLYAVMNLGFWASARIFDYLRQNFGEQNGMDILGFHLSTYRSLFLVSFGFEILLLPLIYYVRKGAEMTDEGITFVPEKTRDNSRGLWNSFWSTVKESAVDTVRLFKGLVGQSGFYRLLGFLFLIGFLKVITTQMDYVFPKFGIRELGPGAPVGQLTSINYILILILVPIIGVLTQRFPAYIMVIIGGTICASSVFIMALPPAWFMGLANGALGDLVAHRYLDVQGTVHPYYVMIALYIAIFSFGEAFYSPRVYEYAAAIAPKGQEASFGALSYIPLLLGKLLVGPGGYLLAAYCPAEGPRHPETMWLIFAIAVSIAPVGLLVFRKYIKVQEAGRE